MGLGRYVVDAVVLEGRSPTQLAKDHGISRSWIYELLARYRAGGYPALEPRSRRPRSCAHETPPKVVGAILKLRADLLAAGHDAGPHTIAQHLTRRHLARVPSLATIWRILKRRGLITAQPQKRPRASFVRFEASLPNERWQGDITHWQLGGGTSVEIFNVLDDHSRLALASSALPTLKAVDVVDVFGAATGQYGLPESVLTDNAAVFSGESRQGKVLWETELERLGIQVIHSSPYHPQTCGKVERFHQTLKRYLRQQAPARSLAHLQAQLDRFRAYYNQRRPHRALHGRTPLVAFHARLRARPHPAAPRMVLAHFRVRADKVDSSGRVTLRYLSALRHIYVGRAHKGEAVRLFVVDDHVRIVRADGQLLRELTLDPSRNYQPRDEARTPVHNVLRQVSSIS